MKTVYFYDYYVTAIHYVKVTYFSTLPLSARISDSLKKGIWYVFDET